jgi:hydrogenase/urease accessory protein HupE
MAEVVYVLCAMTSLVCAVLLQRAWRSARTPLLFWSALCFAGLAVNNSLLVVDFVVLPAGDLSILRSLVALGSLAAMIYGLVWEKRGHA